MTNDTTYTGPIERPSAFAGRLMSAGRRLLSALALAVGLFFIAPTALAQTVMLGANGAAAAPAASSCPAGLSATVCSGGWFAIDGADDVVVRVWETTGTGTATVILEQAWTSAGTDPWTLKTWTDPAATEVPLVFDGGRVGWVHVRVTAVGASGVVKATVRVIRKGPGGL